MTNTVIGAAKLSEFLFSCGCPEAFCADNWYALPALEWVQGDGAKAIFKRVCREVGNYQDESSDCDDFAFAAAAEARRLHRLTMQSDAEHPNKDCALAFGMFPYVTRKGTAHTLNCFVYRIGDTEPVDLRLAFFEPQPSVCRVVELTQKEILSCPAPQF